MTRELRSLEPRGIFSLGQQHRPALARIGPAQATTRTPAALALSVRQDKYRCTGRFDVDCSVAAHHKNIPGGLEGRGVRGATRHLPNGEERPVRRARVQFSRLSDPYPSERSEREYVAERPRARRGLPSHDLVYDHDEHDCSHTNLKNSNWDRSYLHRTAISTVSTPNSSRTHPFVSRYHHRQVSRLGSTCVHFRRGLRTFLSEAD